ncbi:MAG: hypothetical protein LBC62_06185 [Treponema sp.]|jgi:hypothetical protein|nr:hypothetical protein [Treponema sp.]
MSWPVIASGLSLFFCLFAFFYFRAYINRRTSQESALAEIREEINLLILRINETTDKDVTLLEDKEKSLKALLEETEKRLKVYSRELERSAASSRVLPALTDRVPAQDNPAPRQAPAQAAEPRFTRAERQIPPEPKPIGEQIRDLANMGFSSQVIASKLGISITEAELAVALMERSSFKDQD